MTFPHLEVVHVVKFDITKQFWALYVQKSGILLDMLDCTRQLDNPSCLRCQHCYSTWQQHDSAASTCLSLNTCVQNVSVIDPHYLSCKTFHVTSTYDCFIICFLLKNISIPFLTLTIVICI